MKYISLKTLKKYDLIFGSGVAHLYNSIHIPYMKSLEKFSEEHGVRWYLVEFKDIVNQKYSIINESEYKALKDSDDYFLNKYGYNHSKALCKLIKSKRRIYCADDTPIYDGIMHPLVVYSADGILYFRQAKSFYKKFIHPYPMISNKYITNRYCIGVDGNPPYVDMRSSFHVLDSFRGNSVDHIFDCIYTHHITAACQIGNIVYDKLNNEGTVWYANQIDDMPFIPDYFQKFPQLAVLKKMYHYEFFRDFITIITGYMNGSIKLNRYFSTDIPKQRRTIAPLSVEYDRKYSDINNIIIGENDNV